MKLYVDNLENIEVISFKKFVNSFEVQGESNTLVEYPKRYKVENGILIDIGLLEIEKERLREKRKALLKAFDIYKSNVEYGTILETKDLHDVIVIWYRAILDMNEHAINNPPEVIVKYL